MDTDSNLKSLRWQILFVFVSKKIGKHCFGLVIFVQSKFTSSCFLSSLKALYA